MLATLLLAALTGAAFPAAGTYRYTASMGGQTIGSWALTVSQAAAQTQIDENSSANVMGMQLAATASLVLGTDLAPLRYTGTYRTPTQSPSVSVALTPTSATVIGALTNQPRQFTLAAQSHHFVVIEPGLMAGLFALPAQLAGWKDATVTWITPATAQASALTAGSVTSAPRPAGVSAQDTVISIAQPIALTIWYDPATFVPDQIDVPSQNAVLTRVR
jgi:hypothetical protein